MDELKIGLDAAKRITEQVNEEQRRGDNKLLKFDLIERVEDWKGLNVEDFGDLLLWDRFPMSSDSTEKEYYLFLFKRILICCKESTKKKKRKGKDDISLYILKGNIYVSSIQAVKDISQPPNQIFGLQVHWKNAGEVETFALKCRNNEQVTLWSDRMTKLLQARKSMADMSGIYAGYMNLADDGDEAEDTAGTPFVLGHARNRSAHHVSSDLASLLGKDSKARNSSNSKRFTADEATRTSMKTSSAADFANFADVLTAGAPRRFNPQSAEGKNFADMLAMGASPRTRQANSITSLPTGGVSTPPNVPLPAPPMSANTSLSSDPRARSSLTAETRTFSESRVNSIGAKPVTHTKSHSEDLPAGKRRESNSSWGLLENLPQPPSHSPEVIPIRRNRSGSITHLVAPLPSRIPPNQPLPPEPIGEADLTHRLKAQIESIKSSSQVGSGEPSVSRTTSAKNKQPVTDALTSVMAELSISAKITEEEPRSRTSTSSRVNETVAHSSPTHIRVKVHYESDCFMIAVPTSSTSFRELHNRISKKLQMTRSSPTEIPINKITFKDEFGDHIHISCDEDVSILFDMLVAKHERTLVLYVR